MSVTELHPGPTRQPPPGRLLSAAEEVALAKRIEQGDLDAKDEMIESNLGLVQSLARTSRGRHVPLGDLVADERAVDPSAAAIQLEDRDEVSAMLRLLPERHRQVLVRRYGLNDSPVHSHKEIAQWLGVGEERSRQIEREALHRLRSI